MSKIQVSAGLESTMCCAPIFEELLSEVEADELAAILKAIADPARLRIVSLIANSESGEICACDLPDLLERSQPTVSHHLSQLANAGIVEREQRGKWAWFSLRTDRLDSLCRLLAS